MVRQLGTLSDLKIEFWPLPEQVGQFSKALAFVKQVQVVKLALGERLIKRLDESGHGVRHQYCVFGVHIFNCCDQVH